MSRKHAELEREFIDDLVSRTGRSLQQWMTAIAAAGLADKNAIIDWLRPQGLTFAHASWLERIHHNSGRPIYLDSVGQAKPVEPPASAPVPPGKAPAADIQTAQPSSSAMPSRQIQPRPPPRPAAPTATTAATPTSTPAAGSVQLSDLLARGKGLRPLAELVIREIGEALPGVVATAAGDLVSFGRPAELAVLWIGPRELRLGLDLGDAPPEGMVIPARLTGTGARITHMVVLSDARQINPDLRDLVRRADLRANPGA